MARDLAPRIALVIASTKLFLPPYDASASGFERVFGANQRGVLGITAIALTSAAVLAGLQAVLLQHRPGLNTSSSSSFVSRTARFDPDPSRRREARLILASRQADAPENQLRLIQNQGWGMASTDQLLAPISLKLEALALEKLKQPEQAKQRWQYLLAQFPTAPPTADALYALAKPKQLLLQFPAHPAALAAAVKWQQQNGGSLGGLHLARYGQRWPGAGEAMAAACRKPERPLQANEKQLLAAGLISQGDRAASNRCLGATKTSTALEVEPISAATKAWLRSRELLLKGAWAQAYGSLVQAKPDSQSPPIAARSRFWMGLCSWQLGDQAKARAIWQNQLQQYPFGYYAWRARIRLGVIAPLPQTKGEGLLPAPLAKLESLGLHTEAWEHWRSWRLGRSPKTPGDLWREGQLRLGVGDRWFGLGQLDTAAIEGAARTKAEQTLLEIQRHPLNFQTELAAAAKKVDLDPLLLQGVARQESRLNTTVRSPAGAIGLLQIMPATAEEVAGKKLTQINLEDASLNANLGGQYLRQMLTESNNNIFLAIASYNAGAGAAKSWPNKNLKQLPELWVEEIPYPETRIYVKSVLGNYFSYQQLNRLQQ